MDEQDNTSQGSSIDSVAVFDEVFGGPCWTESCPTPKNCFYCLVCATRDEPRVIGPPTCSYRRPRENATIPVFALRPPTPTILRRSPSPNLMMTRARHSRRSPSILQVPPSLPTIEDDETQSNFKLNELKNPVYDTISIDQSIIPSHTEHSAEICEYYPPHFRPASVRPTNLSPLPRSPTSSFSVCESEESSIHWPEFSASVDDIPLSPCNGFMDFPTPLPTPPPPPCIMADEEEDSSEFVRPKIAALEPYCTCIKDESILDAEIQPVPWVHTSDCRIILAIYEARTSFHEALPRETTRANSLIWHTTDDMTARTCLRVTTQPNMQTVVHFFAQYAGFLGVHLTPDQDQAFVAYATEEQSNRARLGLEGLLVSQLQKIHITTVDVEQARREIRGIRTPSFRVYLSRLVCCKKPNQN